MRGSDSVCQRCALPFKPDHQRSQLSDTFLPCQRVQVCWLRSSEFIRLSVSISISVSVSVFRFSPFGFSATRGRVRPVPDLGKQRYVSERPSPLSIPVNHHIVVVVAKIGSLSSFSLQCCAPYCLRYANYRKDSNRCVHYRLQSLWQDDV